MVLIFNLCKDFGIIMATSNSYLLDRNYAVSLLHLNGADASTVFTDNNRGRNPHTWTRQNHGQLKTAAAKFGSAGLRLDGDDYISSSDSPDWYFNSDFTIDCWIKPAAVARYHTLWSQYADSTHFNTWNLYSYQPDTGFYTEFLQKNGGAYEILAQKYVATPFIGVWSHVAVIRFGNIIRFFLNGTQVGTDYTATAAMYDIAGVAYIGTWPGSASYMFQGDMDEFRVSKGIARWISDFSVPTAESAW